MLLRSLLLSIALILPMLALANAPAEGEGEASSRTFQYLPIVPPFIVNIGETGRVGFLKVEISLRVEAAAVAAVEHHMPALRHELVLLLGRQSQEKLEAAEPREAIRLEALEAVRKFIKEADGVEGVTDLLFTSFLLQR